MICFDELDNQKTEIDKKKNGNNLDCTNEQATMHVILM
jgi:hypothetical protein